MAFEGDLLFFGFVSDSEDGVAWDQRLQFDEVRAATLEVGDSAARIVWRGDGDGTWKTRLRAIEHGPGGINARADEAAGCELAAPVLNDVEFTAHVANACDPVGDEQGQRNIFRARKPIAECEMNVHVPEAGDRKEAAAINDWRTAREFCGLAGADRNDAFVVDDQGLIALERAGAYVNDGDMLEDERSVRHG